MLELPGNVVLVLVVWRRGARVLTRLGCRTKAAVGERRRRTKNLDPRSQRGLLHTFLCVKAPAHPGANYGHEHRTRDTTDRESLRRR